MTYAYLRVSTDSQTIENQKLEIKKYCREHRIYHVQYFSDVKSGTVDFKKRELKTIIDNLNRDDLIIVTEISRLGRSISMIFEIMQRILDKGAKLIALKNNFVLNEDDIASKVLIFAFGLSAEIERNLISERTKLGLQRAKQQGKKLGRPKGYKVKPKLQKYKKEIIELLKTETKTYICKKFNVSFPTLQNFIKLNNL